MVAELVPHRGVLAHGGDDADADPVAVGAASQRTGERGEQCRERRGVADGELVDRHAERTAHDTIGGAHRSTEVELGGGTIHTVEPALQTSGHQRIVRVDSRREEVGEIRSGQVGTRPPGVLVVDLLPQHVARGRIEAHVVRSEADCESPVDEPAYEQTQRCIVAGRVERATLECREQGVEGVDVDGG